MSKFLSCFLLVFAGGCAMIAPADSWPERIVATRTLPQSKNLVHFGETISGEASQSATVALIDSVVRGRLPGVDFYVFHHPLHLDPPGVGPGGVLYETATSYRDPLNHVIVLSWWGRPGRLGKPEKLMFDDSWSVGDAPWEVEHYVAGTNDDGKPFIR